MKCKCGGETEVIDTRKFDTVVWRRRSCLKCGLRVNTHETVIEKTDKRMQEQPKAVVIPLPKKSAK